MRLHLAGAPAIYHALPDEAQATQEVREALAATSPPGDGCRNGSNTTLSRYWELDRADKRGTFRVKTYLPNFILPVHYTSRITRAPTSACCRCASTRRTASTSVVRPSPAAQPRCARRPLAWPPPAWR